MLRLDELRERIEARVPTLTGQMHNAAEFSQVVEKGQLPSWRVGAYLLPGGLTGGAVGSISGLFTQAFSERISVVLVTRVQGDPTSAKALDEITPLLRDVVEAVCGYSPDSAPGVFSLASGELVGSQGGALIFQLDFELYDQLRITP